MASTAYGIVSKALLDAQSSNNVQEVDAGAGAYIIEQRDPSGVTLVPYADYYKHENPSTHFVEDGPYIERLETRIIADRAAVKAAFFAGEIDIMPAIADRIEFGEFTGNDEFVTKEVAPTEAHFLAFDNIKFTDKRARQAISLAIDYDALIATLYAGDGVYDGPPVGQALTGFALDQATLKSYREFDPPRARELWEQSGIDLDLIRIETNQDPVAVSWRNSWRDRCRRTSVSIPSRSSTTSRPTSRGHASPSSSGSCSSFRTTRAPRPSCTT